MVASPPPPAASPRGLSEPPGKQRGRGGLMACLMAGLPGALRADNSNQTRRVGEDGLGRGCGVARGGAVLGRAEQRV